MCSMLFIDDMLIIAEEYEEYMTRKLIKEYIKSSLNINKRNNQMTIGADTKH